LIYLFLKNKPRQETSKIVARVSRRAPSGACIKDSLLTCRETSIYFALVC